MRGGWPCWVMHRWLSPNQAEVSMTAKTFSTWVHLWHSAVISAALVGSYCTISGTILRPLMPPWALLIGSRTALIAVVAFSLATAPAIGLAASTPLRLGTGNTTLMVVGVTPRSVAMRGTPPGPMPEPSGGPPPVPPPWPVEPPPSPSPEAPPPATL